jgi:hypothetical protein
MLHIRNASHLLVGELSLCADNGATTPCIRLINLNEQLVVELVATRALAHLRLLLLLILLQFVIERLELLGLLIHPVLGV